MFFEQFEINVVQQARTTIPPAQAENHIDFRIGKGVMQVPQTDLITAGQVTVPLRDTRKDPQLVAAGLYPLLRLERVKGRRTGRGDQTDHPALP